MGDFSSEINVDLQVVLLFHGKTSNLSSQPRSLPRERVSFLCELRHFLFDRTPSGRMSSVAGASRFRSPCTKKKKTPVHLSFQFFFRTTHAKMSTQMSPVLFILLAFRRQNMISCSWICPPRIGCQLSGDITRRETRQDQSWILSWTAISIEIKTNLSVWMWQLQSGPGQNRSFQTS